MISEASGNVYWEISAFQHVVFISSMGGEGGKGRRRLPVPTLDVIETLTKYYVSVFSPRDYSSDLQRCTFLATNTFKQRIGRKSLTRAGAESSQTGGRGGIADYPMWIITNVAYDCR